MDELNLYAESEVAPASATSTSLPLGTLGYQNHGAASHVATATTDALRNGLTCGSTRLPYELWDAIILDGYPNRKTPITSWEVPPHTRWMSCSLVCRQWRRIALPYIFRRIWITWEGRDVREYAIFFAKNQHIARSVHHLHINDRTVEVESLRYLLSSLPKIRSLHLLNTRFERGQDSVISPTHSSFTLECFSWKISFQESPETVHDQISDILSLFSVIKLLSLTSDYHNEPEAPISQISAPVAVSLLSERPQAHAVSLRCGAIMTSWLLTFFLKVGWLDKLTELKLSLNDPLRVVGPLADLLCNVGDTLRSLHINITSSLKWIDIRSPQGTRTETLLTQIHRGLFACSRLEEFSLSAMIYYIVDDPDLCLQGWSIVGTIVQFVPVGYLHHFDLKVQFSGDAGPDICHSLPWGNLRAGLHRFSHLSAITTQFSVFQDLGNASCAPCVEFELQEFKTILRCDVPRCAIDSQCNNSECTRYVQKSNISKNGGNAIALGSDDGEFTMVRTILR